MRRPPVRFASMPPIEIPMPEFEPPRPVSDGVLAVDNHVYFYADVTRATCLTLMEKLRTAAATLRAVNYADVPLVLHIMSDGGEAFAGLAVADQMRQIGWPVHAIIEGLCASAGTLIALACERVAIQRNAFMLIHSLSAGFDGSYEQVKDHTGMLEALNEALIGFYVEHTSAERGRIEEMMKRDTWLTALKALEVGIVHEVLG